MRSWMRFAWSRGPALAMVACVPTKASRTVSKNVLFISCRVVHKTVMIDSLDFVSIRTLVPFYNCSKSRRAINCGFECCSTLLHSVT